MNAINLFDLGQSDEISFQFAVTWYLVAFRTFFYFPIDGIQFVNIKNTSIIS